MAEKMMCLRKGFLKAQQADLQFEFLYIVHTLSRETNLELDEIVRLALVAWQISPLDSHAQILEKQES
jgi:hypothetical protein